MKRPTLPASFNKIAALALCASLPLISACQTPDPGIEVRVIERLVEVPAPCPAERPDRPLPFVKPTGQGLEALAAALAAKLAEYSAPGKYADQAEAYFDACPPAR